jgi:hypothetical protein
MGNDKNAIVSSLMEYRNRGTLSSVHMLKLNQPFIGLLTFLAILLIFLNWATLRPGFILDYDEGMVLMRTMLLQRGYRLHVDIWSDQPIIIPATLNLWTAFIGLKLETGRLFVICSASVLITALFYLQAHFVNHIAAVSTAIAIMISSRFMHYASACMIGVPTLCLSVLTLFFFLLAPVGSSNILKKRLYLILSGFAFCLAMGSKLFTLELAPVLMIAAYARYKGLCSATIRTYFWKDVMLWCSGAFLGVLLILVLVGWDGFLLMPKQLVGTNIIANNVFYDFNIEPFLLALWQDFFVWPIALAGILLTFFHPRSSEKQKAYILIPTMWITVAILGVLFHRPLSPHHYLTFSLPLMWLVGIGIAQMKLISIPKTWRSFKNPIFALPAITAVLFITWLFINIPLVDQHLRTAGRKINSSDIIYISGIADKVHWMVSDDPAYGILTGIPVPPEIAVFSFKRLSVGSLSAEDIRDVMLKYRPELVLISRFPTLHFELPDLRETYREVQRNLFVRKDLLPQNDNSQH